MTTQTETLKLALEAAYLAGFNASGEGYNGEYPFGDKMQDPAENRMWKKDRDNYIKEALAQPEQERNALPKAMNVVIAAMQADPSYAWSWHCNIAMAYVDEGVNRDVANQGAARFMKLLANVEPAHDILPTQTPDTKLNEKEPVATNQQIIEWANRHDFKGSITDLRCAFEDAQTVYTPPQPKEPEQEPVAWLVYAKGSRRYFTLTFDVEKVPEIYKGGEAVPLYTTPPQRKPLTDEQIDSIADKFTVHTGDMWEPELCIEFNDSCKSVHSFARAIEAAHGIKE